MRQTPNAKHVTVHPSGIIEVEGKMEGGQRVGLYVCGEQLETLRRVFAFGEANGLTGDRLGHAFWHIREGRIERCESCG